jgi:hypothetical protein
MQLVYTSPEETTITVTLDAGERLGDLVGPMVAHVPTDKGNRHYAEIVKLGLRIEHYKVPK